MRKSISKSKSVFKTKLSKSNCSYFTIRNAQISLEYLIIVGVALGVLLPGVYFFFTYTKSNIEGTTNDRLNDIGLQMLSTAKSTYALGAGARQTIEFVMPQNVQSIQLQKNGTELVFVYDTPYGLSEAVFYSNVQLVNASGVADINYINLTVEPHPGVSRYVFESYSSNVSVSEVIS